MRIIDETKTFFMSVETPQKIRWLNLLSFMYWISFILIMLFYDVIIRFIIIPDSKHLDFIKTAISQRNKHIRVDFNSVTFVFRFLNYRCNFNDNNTKNFHVQPYLWLKS